MVEACRNACVLCDGAMGTQLIAAGLQPGECGMRWNEENPERVSGVHTAYVDAGCSLITTNSFGGTRSILEKHGFADRVADWNELAAKLAREAAGPGRWVFGDVGPFGDFLEPMGDTTVDELTEIFSAQIAALSRGGVDAILVETMSDPAEAVVAVRAAQAVCALPVGVTYAFQNTAGEFRTMMGNTVAECVERALNAGAQLVGANCGTELTLDDYLRLADALVAAAGEAPVIVQANAGPPKPGANGAVVYDAGPEEMATTARRLSDQGVRVVGGCCGTTPLHLAAMARALDVTRS